MKRLMIFIILIGWICIGCNPTVIDKADNTVIEKMEPGAGSHYTIPTEEEMEESKRVQKEQGKIIIYGTCDVLYKQPTSFPLKIKHRMNIIPGNRKGYKIGQMDTQIGAFTHIELENGLSGWVFSTCII